MYVYISSMNKNILISNAEKTAIIQMRLFDLIKAREGEIKQILEDLLVSSDWLAINLNFQMKYIYGKLYIHAPKIKIGEK